MEKENIITDNTQAVDVEIKTQKLETKAVSDSTQCNPEAKMSQAEVKSESADTPKTSSNDSSEHTENLKEAEKKENQTLKRKQSLQEELGVDDAAHDEVDVFKTKSRPVKPPSHIFIDRKKALKKQLKEGINVKKVKVKMPGQEDDIPDNASDTTDFFSISSWNPGEDIYERDPLGLYGLKVEFLRSLDIYPPIDKWVHVSNFKCDKLELREVLELAGDVLTCSIIMMNKRFAKVQYSHPLEAVQAVTMLNGQLYCGLRLKVFLEKNPKNDVILPKGLGNVGLGLGLQGRPARDIVRQYERYVKNQSSTINPILFREKNYDGDESNKDGDKAGVSQMSVNQFIEFTKTKSFHEARMFKIKHVEELDANSVVLNRNNNRNWSRSPEPGSVKSYDSSLQYSDGKEESEQHNFTESPANSATTSLAESEIPARTPVVSANLSQMNPHYTSNVTHPNMLQNPAVQSQELLIAAFRPHTSGVQQVQFSNRQYFCQLQAAPSNVMSNPMPLQMPYSSPNPMPNVMPNPISSAMSASLPDPNSMSSILTNAIVNEVAMRTNPMASCMSNPMLNPMGSQPMPASYDAFQAYTTRRPGPGPVGLSAVHGGAMAWSVQRQGPASALGPGARPPGPGGSPGNSVTVQFSNLPPSTTFPYLCEKLIQCGHVVSLQFTTPGCAIAVFTHPTYAERCYQIYHGLVVEGHRLVVTFI